MLQVRVSAGELEELKKMAGIASVGAYVRSMLFSSQALAGQTYAWCGCSMRLIQMGKHRDSCTGAR